VFSVPNSHSLCSLTPLCLGNERVLSSYVFCSKRIGPLVGKYTIIYLDLCNPNPLQISLLGKTHTFSSGPAIAGNIFGKLLFYSCVAVLSRSA